MSERTPDPTQVIPLREKLGYALGDFASNLFWMPFVLYGTFFYTDVFGISATAVGVMLLVTRIWDTVNDPMMGLIADRTRPRPGLGRYRPYLFWMALPFGLIGAAAFFTPDLSLTGKLVWAWVTYTAFGMIYTAINIPYSALMSVMSAEPRERAQTSSLRMVGAQLAGLLVSSSLTVLVSLLGGGEDQAAQQRGFFLVMSGFAVVAVLCFLAAGKLTRERVEPDLREQSDIARDLRRIVSCAPWWLLFAISFFTIAAFTLRFGVAAYYFKYYADQQAVESWSGVRGGAISAFFTLGSVSSLVGVAAFSALAKRLDKRVGYVVLIVLSGGVSLLFAVLDPKNVTGMILTQGLFALLTGPTAAVLFAMYTDVAAYIRSRTGTVSDGLVMAAGSFAQKFGWAIGGAMTGILLGLAGYVPDQPQSEEVRGVMSFMMSWAPMICCLVGAALMAVYPLGDARMQAITAELARRDAAARG